MTKGQDIQHPVEISLSEAFHGTSRTLSYENGRRIEAKIPAGVKTWFQDPLERSGWGRVLGGSGDLYLKVTVLPDPKFSGWR